MASKVKVEFKPNKARIETKIRAGSQAMTIAVTEAVLEYAEPLVPVAEGTLKDSAFIASRPKSGLAIWDTPYAKKQYYTHETKNMWAQKAVDRNKKKLDQVAQNAFTKGFGK